MRISNVQKKNNEKQKKVVFSARLRSTDAAGIPGGAEAREWSISGKARNAEAHRVNGDPKGAKGEPKCVRELTGHDRARAALCAGCDRYIGEYLWRKRGKLGAISLINSVAQRDRVRACLPTYRITNRALGTSVCTACVAMFTERARGYDKVLHTAAHAASVDKRLVECAAGPPCEREDAKDGDCDICSRWKTYSRKGAKGTHLMARAAHRSSEKLVMRSQQTKPSADARVRSVLLQCRR